MRCSFLLLLVLSACDPPGASATDRAGSASASASATAPSASAHAESSAPELATIVKVLSWAEPVEPRCEANIEGTAAPAKFMLEYQERGAPAVRIDNDVPALEPAGWTMVTRSERGYGFERSGQYRMFSMSATEELSCTCNADGVAPLTQTERVHVTLEWRAGTVPQLSARMGDGETAEPVDPISVGGRLAIYQLRFARPLPAPFSGECASGFMAALSLSHAVE